MRSTITLLFGFILSYHVNACDCKEFLDNEKIEQADFIADILILKNYDSENDHQQYKADIKINKLYKGNSIESIFIHGVNGNTKNLSTCSIFIPEGTRLIAYSKKTNDKYSIGLCSGLIYLDYSNSSLNERLNSKSHKNRVKTEFKRLEDFNKTQTQEKDYSQNVATLDSTIATLYTVISGDVGVERNWDLFKHLFHKDAKLIPTGKTKEGKHIARYMTPQDYINSSGKWLLKNGFHEVELNRKAETFGNITHVFSTYESYRSKTDEEPFMRGINSIQLMNDGARWWIINIYWMQESAEHPIPETYLPRG